MHPLAVLSKFVRPVGQIWHFLWMSELSDLSRTKCPTENIKNTHLVDESIVHDETKQKTSDHKGQQLGHLAVL